MHRGPNCPMGMGARLQEKCMEILGMMKACREGSRGGSAPGATSRGTFSILNTAMGKSSQVCTLKSHTLRRPLQHIHHLRPEILQHAPTLRFPKSPLSAEISLETLRSSNEGINIQHSPPSVSDRYVLLNGVKPHIPMSSPRLET